MTIPKAVDQMTEEQLWQALRDAENEAARLRHEIIRRLPARHQELLKATRVENRWMRPGLTKMFKIDRLPGQDIERKP